VRRIFRYFGIAAALALALVMIAAAPVMTAGPSAYRAYAEGGGGLDAGMDPELISGFGNIRLVRDGRPVTQDDFEAAGIEYGDIVTVSFLDQQMDMPVVKNYSEVVSDYMVSYYNYYGITPDDGRYDEIVSDNIEKTLKTMFRTDDLKDADLAAEAEEYCREIGLTDGEIEALKAGLGGKKKAYAGPAAFTAALAAALTAAAVYAIYRRKKSGSRQ